LTEKINLRSYCLIDNMQPQYSAMTGTVAQGDIPLAGMAQLFIEVAPGSEVFSMMNIALKSSNVRPGFQIVEREFGLLEVHATSIDEIQTAGSAIIEEYNLNLQDLEPPKIVSSQLISNVDAYQAQLINRFRQGSLLVPGQCLFILEVEPAVNIALACNNAEKASDINLVHYDPVGRFGRLYLSGSEAQIRSARDAAMEAIDN